MLWRKFKKEQSDQFFEEIKKISHKHEWNISKERSHLDVTLRWYKCECGAKQRTIEIVGLEEIVVS